ncbi:hypothetical protein DPMN_074117 [Dreissena polymorpha]|uniref:Uncharacterized protein n=1 Tax=Dreissena polymorpha TaxID=45954 RepID=A0A9D3YJ24_DREPO|nr:hypothetical protein DPMN_074117 [Dreissena polymorpha]
MKITLHDINSKTTGGYIFQQTGTIFDLIQHALKQMKNAPLPGSHIFQPTRTIFKLVQDIIGTNLLTKQNAPTPGGHVFQLTRIILELNQDVVGTYVLNKFHDDLTINVASRPGKNFPPLGGHVFYSTGIIFELFHEDRTINPGFSIWTNLLTKFHEDLTINVASRVLTRKNTPPPSSQVFQPTGTIFLLVQDIIRTILLTKVHEDLTKMWPLEYIIGTNLVTNFYGDGTINVASREKCPAPGSHVFQPNGTIFKLIQDIIGKNLLTKFYDDCTINVTSRVLTRKHAPPPGSHVFQPTGTIFELAQDIIGTNLLTIVLTKFYYSHIMKNAPPTSDQTINVASRMLKRSEINVAARALTRKNSCPIEAIKNALPNDIIGTNLETKFHEDWSINEKCPSHWKNAPPTGGHVFQPTGTTFKIVQDFIGTNLLAKLNDDQTINVASRVLPRNKRSNYSI